MERERQIEMSKYFGGHNRFAVPNWSTDTFEEILDLDFS